MLRIEAAGICGSDLHAWKGRDPRRSAPRVMGHELVGTVVGGEREGERVVVNPLMVCGECEYCLHGNDNLCAEKQMIGTDRAGGFAEFIAVPSASLMPVKASVPAAAAVLVYPLAVCLHAINLVRWLPNLRDQKDQRVLIIGGGTMGILTCLLLRLHGIDDITLSETKPRRRESAGEATAAPVIDPIATELENAHFHTVFDCVGSNETRTSAVSKVADGGVVVHIGLQVPHGDIDARRITLGEIVFAGVSTYTRADFEEALDLLGTMDLGDFSWVGFADLEDGASTFEAVAAAELDAAKMVLKPRMNSTS